jgi:predicted AAA+ superfamily ATPase
MPHTRKRYLEQTLKKCLGFSPLVGLLGHRQVGKTTLLGEVTARYHTLDLKSERDEAEGDPAAYLMKRAGRHVALDECQHVPDLFPELKEWVRTRPQPGQFILSGSVRFTSREAIRESLTGRVVNLELLPMTLAEQNSEPLSEFCPNALRFVDLKSIPGSLHWNGKKLTKIGKEMVKYFTHGGLPGVCFIRDEKLRKLKIDEQLNAILDRDLRQVKKISLSLRDLRGILSSCADQQGDALNYSRIRNETGISLPTIKKVIQAMEAVFLFRIFRIEGDLGRETLYFEDQAEWSHMVSSKPAPIQNFLHFCYTQIRPQFSYRLGDAVEFFQYRTRGGAFVPLAFRSQEGALGVIPVMSSDEVQSAVRSANSFLKTYALSKVLIVHADASRPVLLQPRILALPIGVIV